MLSRIFKVVNNKETSKCGKNTNDTLAFGLCASSFCSYLILTSPVIYYYKQTRTVTWSLFVKSILTNYGYVDSGIVSRTQ